MSVPDSSAVQVSTARELRDVYSRLWSICPGWNRVPFRVRQLRFLLRERRVELHVAPLEGLDAFSLVVEGRRCICVDETLVPPSLINGGTEHLLAWIGSVEGSYLRLVLLHEIAHLFLHSDTFPTLRTNGAEPIPQWSPVAADNDAQSESLLREIEADFFAVIASVPDALLLRLERAGRLNRLAVARILGEREVKDDPRSDFLRSLAEYRIHLYSRLASAFFDVSQAVSGSYRKTSTLDETQPFGEHRSGENGYVLGDILRGHPLSDSLALTAPSPPAPFQALLDPSGAWGDRDP